MSPSLHPRSWFVVVAAGLGGCSGTGQPEVSLPALVVAAGTKEFSVEDITVTLDKATLAFGPVYFCASASGSANLCDAALGEILDVARLDGLAAEPQMLGTFHGFTGDIRSASYDYGVHWFLTEKEPLPSPEAPSGHSALVEGTASRGAASVRFVAEVDVVAPFQGERAVPTTKVEGRVDEGTARVEVRFDVASWFSAVDWGAVLASPADPYRITKGSQQHTALVTSMVSWSPPSFDFVRAP